MTIKEQDNQLVLGLLSKIVLSIVVWFCIASFMIYRIWTLQSKQSAVTTIAPSIPTLKTENIATLSSSLKSTPSSSTDLIINRPEPFD